MSSPQFPTVSGWGFVRARARMAETVVAGTAVLLGLMCLIPLFRGMSWVLSAVLVVIVVGLLGAASRAIAIPLPLIPIVELLGVIGTLTALFASDAAWLKVMPTSEAWDVLRALIRSGMIDAAAMTAPVPTETGLVLLAVGGAGLAALSVDVLFVSVRSPVLAGLPLLTLFLGSSFMQFGRAPWWLFLPAAVGWLLILAADQRDRVREWAAVPASTRIQGLSPAARRTGALAIVVAMVTALVLPVRGVSALDGAGSGSGKKAAAAVVLDPLVSLRRDLTLGEDTTVLRYNTGNPEPPYLRVTALEAFDGVTWSPRSGLANGRAEGLSLPGSILDRLTTASPTYHVRGGASYTYDFSVTSLQNSYLPLPFPITSMTDISGMAADWRFDPDTGVAFSKGRPATGVKYEVTALDPRLQPVDLRDATSLEGSVFPQASVPRGTSPLVRRLANEVTADATSPYDKALALQRWFTRDGGFRYSTSVRSGAGADYLAEFLQDRIGYCEQFAASMALMARTIGIPSRVVVGFTQGSKVAKDTWEVTVRDAHAWPELWFDNVGWVRFEPTPRSGGTVQAPAYAPTPFAAGAVPDARDPRGLRDAGGFVPASGDGQTDSRRRLTGLAAVVLLAGALVVAAVPAVRRLRRRRRRLHGGDYDAVVQGAWAEIGDSAVDLGRPWSVVSTPRQAGARLAAGMTTTGRDALRRLVLELEQVRYAPARPASPDAAGRSAAGRERSAAVRADVKTVVSEWRERAGWRTRLASYCWPPSARRRQRSSSRSMNPGDLRGVGADGLVGAASSTGRTWNDE